MNLNGPDRQKRLLIITCAAIGLLMLEYWVRVPLTNLWQSQSTELAQLKKSVTDGRATIARGPQTQRTWMEMRSAALASDPTEAEQAVLTTIEGLARSTNVELSYRPQWKRGTTSDRYSLFENRMDVTGSISTLSRFLYEIEKSPLPLRVESLDLTARDDMGNRLTLGLIVSGLRLTPLERTRLQ